MRPNKFLSIVVGLLFCTAGSAAVVSFNVEITASDFVKSSGSPSELAPPPLQLNFDIIFDNAFDIFNATEGLKTNSSTWSNLASYSYEKSRDLLDVRSAGDSSFSTQIVGITGIQPTSGGVDRNTAAGYWLARRIDVRVVALPVPVSVPEPATLALASLGLAATALFRRKFR